MDGWMERDYQSPLYMDTWRERGAEEGKERLDGQCQIWMDNVREDLKKKNIDLTKQDWRGDQTQRGLEESC